MSVGLVFKTKRAVPQLREWLTFAEVADYFGVTKQAVHKAAFDRNKFETLRALGSKPLYVVARSEVTSMDRLPR